MNNEKQLIDLLEKYSKAEIDNDILTETTSLDHDLGIDSIMLLQLVVDIEDEFSISILDDELDADIIGTFGGMLRLVNEKTMRAD
jgi:acyl carrier protein